MSNLQMKDIFQKDITRKINGVVKADQNGEDVVFNELSEYVVTSELKKYFEKFFDRYVQSINFPTEDVGVWISGFYGSGKSHFLKMIGHILENKEYSGRKVTDFFKEKIDDSILMGNIEKSSEIPTDVVLFNVDSVSDQDSYQNKDSIAVAFLKSLNGHMGFSKDNLKIAEFERKIWEDGKLEEFKEVIEDIAGKEWKDIIRNLDFHQDDFIEAVEELDIMSAESAERWIEKSDRISVSPESLADIIEHYLKLKSPNHRIVFLVDEIGQYIGDNSQLMLNLQTLVEILGLRFRGRVWVGVTSQQDLGNIIATGEHKRNDFSKIQDRFKTMLSLSSGNIDEVIKKRLLEKKKIDKEDLEKVYTENHIKINNIIYFDKKGMTLPIYKDYFDFSETYPFVDYQFSLLQKVFEKIRDMGHSGQHMSRGERSLLNSFQEAGVRVANKEVGTLIPFNYFYESIEQFLEDIAKRPFTIAQNERGVSEFDLEVLKLLFLLKGINGVETNINNLTSFMIDSIECNRVELEKKIKRALIKLEQEVLIQKDGENYYFLTNEEQDINKEINQEEFDYNDIYRELSNYIFNEIFDKNSVISEENGNKYSFSKKIDDCQISKKGEQLDLVVMTPYSDEIDKISLLGARDEYNLIIKLPSEDKTYLEEIKQSIKVSSFIRRKTAENTRDIITQILLGKQKENQSRKKRILLLIEKAILESEIYIYGEKIEVSRSGSVGRVIELALQEEIKHRFKSASFIKKTYDENTIKNILSYSYEGENLLFDIKRELDSNANKQAINEVRSRIELLSMRGMTITLKELVDYFTKAPYGWGIFSVNGIVAELWNYKIINIEDSREKVTNSEEIKSLLIKIQNRNLEKVTINLKEEIDTELLKKVNNILKEIFINNEEVKVDSPKDDLIKILECRKNIANSYIAESKRNNYPGKKELENWVELLDDFCSENKNKQAEKVLKDFVKNKTEFKEEYFKQIDVEEFYRDKSSKRIKFDEGRSKVKEIDENLGYLKSLKDLNEYKELVSILEDKKPYIRIREIDDLIHTINLEENKIIENEKELLKEKLKENRLKLEVSLENEEIFIEKLNEKINSFQKRLEVANSIKLIMSEAKELENLFEDIEADYKNSIKIKIDEIKKEALKTLEDKDDVKNLTDKIKENYENLKNDVEYKKIENIKELLEVAERDKEQYIAEASGKAKKKERVRIEKIHIVSKYNIETKEDIEEYIEKIERELKSLKEKMIENIENNKIIDID